MLLTIQKDCRRLAGWKHRCSFSHSKFLSSVQDCRRSRDKLVSKNAVINLPGHSWLKASHTINYEQGWTTTAWKRKRWKQDRLRVSFLLLQEKQEEWVQWGAEGEEKSAPPAADISPASAWTNWAMGYSCLAVPYLVLDNHFDLPSVFLPLEMLELAVLPNPGRERLLLRGEASDFCARFQGNKEGKMGKLSLIPWKIITLMLLLNRVWQ